ncbi:MAG: hypothetical protein GEU75_16125 [Dehalococcoidia bacterium]|nr:hypothetical protein [Dehalococcoidia bacterium]
MLRRIERDHLLAHGDLVSDEICQHRAVQDAADRAEQSDVVRRAQFVLIQAELLAQPDGQQSPPKSVFERLACSEVRGERKRSDDLSEADLRCCGR